MNARSIAICAAYCILSSACVIHNKYLLSSIFPLENALLLTQNTLSISLLIFFNSMIIKAAPKPISLLHIELELYHRASDWIIGLCYSLSVVTGVWCLAYLSIPMFSSIKRCNVVAVWAVEFFFARSATTMKTLNPILALVAGTVLTTLYDLEFSAIGYVAGTFSCLFQAAAFELGKVMVDRGKALWSVMLINSVVSTIVQLLWMGATNELDSVGSLVHYLFGGDGFPLDGSSIPLFIRNAKRGYDHEAIVGMTPQLLWMHLLFNAALIMMMNFVIFLNCSVNSPLVHTVTGNLKAVLTVIPGIVMFAVPIRPWAGVGIVVGFLGGVWFSWVKLEHELGTKKAQMEASNLALMESAMQQQDKCLSCVGGSTSAVDITPLNDGGVKEAVK